MPPSTLYKQFTERLYAQNQFSIKLGLGRVGSALAHIGHPESSFGSVIVAGTNGKGTTAALLAAIVGEHGLKVGLYTSPHLIDVRERFRVSGRPVSPQRVLEVGLPVLATFAGDDLDPELHAAGLELAQRRGWTAWDDADGPLTFFELTTVMALSIFADEAIDVAVLEVGLGGRLDAVNVVDPMVTVITSIALDHQQFLGTSLEAIAAEKGATMRAGRPVIVADQVEERARRTLVKIAADRGAVLTPTQPLSADLPAWLEGDFRANAEVAAAAAHSVLVDRRFGRSAPSLARLTEIAAGFRWPGRRDRQNVPGSGVLAGAYLLDAAHNPAGAISLARYLQGLSLRPAVGLLGAMADKDLDGIASPVARCCDEWIATRADTPRAATSSEVAGALTRAGAANVRTDQNLRAALIGARSAAGDRPVLVCGSVYLVGAAMEELGLSADSLSIAC